MASIFSTQNLQTFLRRKYLRPPAPPPSRPPPGPPGREEGRRSLRSGRSPPEDEPEDDSDDVGLVSSAMMLLKSIVGHLLLVIGRSHSCRLSLLANDQRPTTNDGFSTLSLRELLQPPHPPARGRDLSASRP